MGWIGWAGIGIVAANVVFVGILFIIAAVQDRRERNGKRNSG